MQRSFLGQVMTTRPCAACQGFGEVITDPCFECSGEGRVRNRRTLKIKVPAGVDTGTRIQLTGEGEVGPGGGPAGDLYVEVDGHAAPDLPAPGRRPALLGGAADDGGRARHELLHWRPSTASASWASVGTQPGDVMTLAGSGSPSCAAGPWRPARPRQRADADPSRQPAGGTAAAAGDAARRGAPEGRLPRSHRACSASCATRSRPSRGPRRTSFPAGA